MALRLVIYVQLAWVALIGALCRGLLPKVIAGWVDNIVESLIPSALWGFPILVIIAMRRARLPELHCFLIVLVEAGLIVASVIALWPAIQ